MPDITNLAINTTINAKINEIKGEIPSITTYLLLLLLLLLKIKYITTLINILILKDLIS